MLEEETKPTLAHEIQPLAAQPIEAASLDDASMSDTSKLAEARFEAIARINPYRGIENLIEKLRKLGGFESSR